MLTFERHDLRKYSRAALSKRQAGSRPPNMELELINRAPPMPPTYELEITDVEYVNGRSGGEFETLREAVAAGRAHIARAVRGKASVWWQDDAGDGTAQTNGILIDRYEAGKCVLAE